MKICPACKTEFQGGEVFCPNDGARLQTPSQLAAPPLDANDVLVGQILDDRYRILRRIGEGGMGIVYEAEHVVIEKRVALKVLRDDFSSRSEVVQRFRQEAKSASKIGNAHIVDISDFGETPAGAIYFVMELLEGEDLANVLQRDSTIPLHRAVDILSQCCVALGAAHAKGIVHRDMKPENIFLVTRDGRPDFVKIVDFGIAKMSDIETQGAPGRKLTKTGMIFGTPEYMSPEQAAGKELDHRVDVYALGVIFFEMLTGRVPFVGDTFMGILTQHMFEEPPRLTAVNPNVSVDASVEGFIDRALAKDPGHRFQGCEEMRDALSRALGGEDVRGGTFVGYGEPVKYKPKGARAVSPQAVTQEFVAPGGGAKRSGLGLAIGIGAGIGIAAVAGVGLWLVGGGGAEAVTPPVAEPPHEEPVVAPSAVDSGSAEVATDAGSTEVAVAPSEPDAGPATIAVRVVTRPEGARVWVVGRGDVCQETPCSFETAPGETITVRARQGRTEGEIEITPEAATEITIPLRAPRGGGGGRTKQDDSGGGGGGHGDLKIPDVFRRPR
ncbi:serine/threonine-protein kinase [Sandaracinus amylolyticus]|uniref:serine/threonine-protein kinase n=1 Tax=Sandaracinus amylolyticus TaxID=927083 RepID=UPI001F15787A|nr:serine/threonine-protein kinase [Sandaracinus amylolyticus]UJR79399.1 Serine/threonine protein kinase PrkC, regulator of stationary phase [Sandaracinus amylolyticus]